MVSWSSGDVKTGFFVLSIEHLINEYNERYVAVTYVKAFGPVADTSGGLYRSTYAYEYEMGTFVDVWR